MSATPAGGADSAPSYGLDPTFGQFQLDGEIELRYKLWDQPGTIKMTGFLIRGRMGNFDDALALSRATGLGASYSYAVCPSAEISLDYQFIRNPAYNTDRGPVNVFALRLHLHF
jgi:high affinity Mn2+ porin